jgi:hypothetical protein
MYGQMRQSGHMGGHGGGLNDFVQPTLSLVGAKGRCGASLDQIQFLFVDINSGQYFETPAWGGNGGGQWIYQAPPGQWIDRVEVTWNDYVQGVTFTSNGGDKSRRFGGNGRQRETFHAQGQRITGVQCRAGALVDALVFFASS